MLVTALSDTHGYHREIKINPLTELILFAGDVSNIGEIDLVRDFDKWIEEMGIPTVMVAGNHDFCLENTGGRTLINKALYLEGNLIKLRINNKTINIWGSPKVPRIGRWAFGYDQRDAPSIWNRIPPSIDILLTHVPPFGILDNNGYYSLGCPYLLKKVEEIKPQYHIFGHIHEDGGRVYKRFDTTFINASYCGFPDYKNKNQVIEFEI